MHIFEHSLVLPVIVFAAPPYWKDGQPPEDVNTAEEESAQFNCEVEGVPAPEISWLVNGVPIEGMFVTFLCCFTVHVLVLLCVCALHK